MKAHYRTRDGRMTFEVDGEAPKDVFKKIADIQEVFDETACGVCNGPIKFRVRTVEDNDYYEQTCQDPACRAKLAFGQYKKGGGLFRKVTEGEGTDRKYLPNRGWVRYNGNGK